MMWYSDIEYYILTLKVIFFIKKGVNTKIGYIGLVWFIIIFKSFRYTFLRIEI